MQYILYTFFFFANIYWLLNILLSGIYRYHLYNGRFFTHEWGILNSIKEDDLPFSSWYCSQHILLWLKYGWSPPKCMLWLNASVQRWGSEGVSGPRVDWRHLPGVSSEFSQNYICYYKPGYECTLCSTQTTCLSAFCQRRPPPDAKHMLVLYSWTSRNKHLSYPNHPISGILLEQQKTD